MREFVLLLITLVGLIVFAVIERVLFVLFIFLGLDWLSFLDGFRGPGSIEIGERQGSRAREVAVQLYTALCILVWS